MDALRQEWARNRRPIPDLLEPIDGRKMACDAEMLFQVTGDPIFGAVQDALEAYGLDKGEPTRSFDRLVRLVDEGWRFAPRQVEAIIASGKKHGVKVKLASACAKVAATLGLDANSFDAAVQRLRKRVRSERQVGYPAHMDGDTGRRMLVKTIYDEPMGWIPPTGLEVPDTLFWRQKLYSGKITANFVLNSPQRKPKLS